MKESDAKEIFRIGYQHFENKNYLRTLELFEPILNGSQKIENDKLNLHSLMWGIAGDSLVYLKAVDDAVIAYRKSIELDKYSGCIDGYAWLVAKYNLYSELPYAFDCLKSYDEYRGGPLFWRTIYSVLCGAYLPRSLCYSTFIMPFVRRKLRKMMNKKQNTYL